jgi:hypothetical protein
MAISSQTSFLLGLGVILLFIATPVAAFGAGDIVDVSSVRYCLVLLLLLEARLI